MADAPGSAPVPREPAMPKPKLVTSREYKVMLRPELFNGDETAFAAAVGRFWADLGARLARIDIPVEGDFGEVKAIRLIRFFDTDDQGLHGESYIVRERLDTESEERQVTLKFRHPDRYVAGDRVMEAASETAKTKFEEDVKPPFVSVFSFSTTADLDAAAELGTLGDVADIFPGLKDAVDELPWEAPLQLVSGFTAKEVVLAGANILLGKRDIPAECAMVLWYDEGEQDITPVVAEFSFKYGDDQEDYRGSVARDAYDVLTALQNDLTDWVDPNPRTKTSFVYE